MTIDDEKSIYVGGLPYDATEETLRKAFVLYGAVVAVKVINDRGIGGKCYGFVTFRNPRSAVQAISDMDGRTIEGRVVKVNEVKTRGGRSNFNRESFRPYTERGMDFDRGRNRERDYDHVKDRYRNRTSGRSRDRDGNRSREHDGDWSREHDGERSRERDWSRDRDGGRSLERDGVRSLERDQDRERGYGRTRDHDQTSVRFLDRDRDQHRGLEDKEQEHSRNHDQDERDHDMDLDRAREITRTNDYYDKTGDSDEDQLSKKQNGSGFNDHRSREFSSDSSDYHDQVKEQLECSIQRHKELQKEISVMEEKVEDKQQLVMDLQKKSQKLEDALTIVKKLSSNRQVQLTKLHKSFLQVKDYGQRLKSCEQELQSLVDTTMVEVDFGEAAGLRDAHL